MCHMAEVTVNQVIAVWYQVTLDQRPCNLSPCNIFLLGCLKPKVCKMPPLMVQILYIASKSVAFKCYFDSAKVVL